MTLLWTAAAADDLARLHDFLAAVNEAAAASVIRSLTAAATKLVELPRLGVRLEEFEEREVRRLVVGNYEVRYEVSGGDLFILRLWHTRENR